MLIADLEKLQMPIYNLVPNAFFCFAPFPIYRKSKKESWVEVALHVHNNKFESLLGLVGGLGGSVGAAVLPLDGVAFVGPV